MATAMAAHGRGFASSGEVRPRRVRLSSVRASGGRYHANQAKRRGWEGLSGSWPCGAPTPVRSRHGGGGGNGECALTKTQSTRLRGGGDRGEHGEAMDELADMFLQWRASSSSSKLLQLLLWGYGRTEEAKEIEIELGSWLTGALGVLMSWPTVPGHPRRVAARSGDRRRAAHTRPSDSEPVEHYSSPFSDPNKPDSATSTH